MKNNKFKYLLFILFLGAFILPLLSRHFWLGEIFISFYFLIFLGHVVGTTLFLLLKDKALTTIFLCISLYEGFMVWGSYAPHTKSTHQAQNLTIFQYNVYYQNRRHDLLIDWLKADENNYDLVFLVEATPPLVDKLDQLKTVYPYAHYYTHKYGFNLVVLSKIPFEPTNNADAPSSNIYSLSKIKLESGESINFYGVHLSAPHIPETLESRNLQLKYLGEIINADETPYKILVGDFNTSNYSYYFKDLLTQAGLKDGPYSILEQSWPTWAPKLFRTNIDHCLVSERITILERKLGPDLGSDHLPVITKIALNQSKGYQ